MEVLRKMSHKSSSIEPELLEVPVRHGLNFLPSSDDYDSDFSDTYDADDPDDLEEEEKALVTAYLHDPPALHIRRTLDQYYYHMLDNTKERDMDQVVSRWAKHMKSEARHNILMLKATNKYYEERKNKLLVDLLDIREEVKLLVEIKDILDEINIILSVLDIQRTVIEQRQKAEGFNFLGNSAAEDLIKADIDDFKKLEGHSRTIQEKVWQTLQRVEQS
ncbi:hypothetical protein J4E93_007081 [Alternaria ventricosa]|uniref:uncharacterized protein n=1 Tax=Alternaria ventricosa TaxID=1187951 RepID=UPI0020C22D8A|nr:uncharacterized protein J4E93_007081 [Alternaria ventricosa]KAI4643012.1 hypothetical protein J4E93_007081 [Alternaria ventricosa]